MIYINEFIHSKTNGLEYIIKRENPQIIYKDPIDIDQDNYRYEKLNPGKSTHAYTRFGVWLAFVPY